MWWYFFVTYLMEMYQGHLRSIFGRREHRILMNYALYLQENENKSSCLWGISIPGV